MLYMHAHKISIHAAHAGSDIAFGLEKPVGKGFQSTLPMRAATLAAAAQQLKQKISIHAARVGSDQQP